MRCSAAARSTPSSARACSVSASFRSAVASSSWAFSSSARHAASPLTVVFCTTRFWIWRASDAYLRAAGGAGEECVRAAAGAMGRLAGRHRWAAGHARGVPRLSVLRVSLVFSGEGDTQAMKMVRALPPRELWRRRVSLLSRNLMCLSFATSPRMTLPSADRLWLIFVASCAGRRRHAAAASALENPRRACSAVGRFLRRSVATGRETQEGVWERRSP